MARTPARGMCSRAGRRQPRGCRGRRGRRCPAAAQQLRRAARSRLLSVMRRRSGGSGKRQFPLTCQWHHGVGALGYFVATSPPLRCMHCLYNSGDLNRRCGRAAFCDRRIGREMRGSPDRRRNESLEGRAGKSSRDRRLAKQRSSSREAASGVGDVCPRGRGTDAGPRVVAQRHYRRTGGLLLPGMRHGRAVPGAPGWVCQGQLAF
jgi:hypothetical protein